MKNNFEENIFFAKSVDYNFRIVRYDNSWILKKGSKVNAVKTWNKYNGNVPYTNIFYSKFICTIDENNILTEDILWNAITPIVAFAKGNLSGNGWFEVKNSNNKTPHEIYRIKK